MQNSREVIDYGADLKKQISHWQDRAKGLEQWKTTHDYNHPDWVQNSRDLNNAYLKIDALKSRYNGEWSNKKKMGDYFVPQHV